MTDAEFQQIEDKLGLKLPAAYRDIVRQFPDDLREWPPLRGQTANQKIEDFLLDVNAIVKAQQAARKRLGRALPPHSFIFGRTGGNYWLIDASLANPPVLLVFDGMVLDGPANLAEHLERVRANHTQAWAKIRRRLEAGDKANLSADALVAVARKMARPAVLLAETGTEYCAIWKGTGVVPPPVGKWEHWVSIDTRFLPDNPRKLQGVLSVYLCLEDGERYEQVGVVHDPQATLPNETGGKRLFARRIDCVPPIEALFKFGPQPIQDWLAAHSVDPNHGINPAAFPDQAPLRAYVQVLNSEHPFYANADCYAMLGGWSWCFMWCYGIDVSYPWHLFDKALVVLTVRDEEPWLEVFDDGKEFITFSRIT